MEIEQWLIPVGYRPDPGDRALIVGRWIVDCGHDDWHAELHPQEVLVSSFLQTAPLNVGLGATTNLPSISERWSELTNGSAATVAKVVITGAWQGGGLEFDIWPPARPSADAVLQWQREPGIFQGGIQIATEAALPCDNANHVHVRLTAPDFTHDGGTFGDIYYNQVARAVTAYMAWWTRPAAAPRPAPCAPPPIG